MQTAVYELQIIMILFLLYSAAAKHYRLYFLLCEHCKIMMLTVFICHHSGSERC